ncbi:hypothetical protein ACFQE8_07760 [Salinirubellus sp. GCM10025818]|uniref:hypothetical protein n=1 Tax=Salinirubellus TaxID=2162630 RepID=UPI0030CE4E4E
MVDERGVELVVEEPIEAQLGPLQVLGVDGGVWEEVVLGKPPETASAATSTPRSSSTKAWWSWRCPGT